jgi:hypothetical protein
MYLMNVIAALSSSLEWLGKVSLFHYYNDWLYNGFDWLAVGVILVVCVAATLAAVGLFARRDVRG